MFEDDPPPLPSPPCFETLCSSAFADLSDHNRFTAVADDDCTGNDAEFRSHMSVVHCAESGPDFVNPEIPSPDTESGETKETLNGALKLVTKTAISNDSTGEQNPSPSSLYSRFQFLQISETQNSLDDSQKMKCFVPTLSAQEDKIMTYGSHDILTFGKGRKDLVRTGSSKDEINERSNLQHFCFTDENESAQTTLQEDQDDDEFGDFEESVKAEENQKSDGESWADFKSSSLPDSDIKNKSTERVTSSGAEFRLTPEMPLLPSLLENFCNDQLWTVVGGEEVKSDDHDIPDSGVYETLSDALKTKVKDRPDKIVWIAVSIIEEALALKLQWHDSLIRSRFLHSLDVDVNQTVIRNSDLPSLAQQLEESGVLPPISAVDGCSRAVDKNPSSASQQTYSGSTTIDSLAVPPVQFDWNTSGLTNPLKTGSLSVSSAPLDLDFLDSSSNKDLAAEGSTMQVFSALQKDLTALGLNYLDDGGKSKTETDVPSNIPIILDCIPNKIDVERKCKPVSELSLDARALHDQLPDLDYMLSSILLFPIVDR